MKINKTVKILIGILTAFTLLGPFIMPVLAMGLMIGLGFPFIDPYIFTDYRQFNEILLPMMMIFYPTMMCYSFIQLGLQIFYIIHEIKNKTLTDTFRILFVIGTFLLSYITMPIYFIAYMWKEKQQEAQTSATETAN